MVKQLVCSFKELRIEQTHLAGGKAGTLAHLSQKGYSVPKGFIIMPMAFEKDELIPEAWGQVQAYLEKIRQDRAESPFAVRSSALSEDFQPWLPLLVSLTLCWMLALMMKSARRFEPCASRGIGLQRGKRA